MERWLVIAECTFITICLYYSQVVSTSCNSTKSCGECIQLGSMCGWCQQDNYTLVLRNPRCDLIESLKENGCTKITNPTSETINIKNLPLSDAESGAFQIVQVKPQEIRVRLRPGETETVNLQVRPATDYPVDLYYVMDLSHSMADDLHNLKLLGVRLAREMMQLTTDIRLGFGSFVDKPVTPYVNAVPGKKIQAPCEGCEAPYGFRNALPLDSNTAKFTEAVAMQNISGNVDQPEGGLDALMQITVCQSDIGWRQQAKHLVVYTSDNTFHFVGDGKLGGIVTPNDGRCHLDPVTQYYNMSRCLDYPSIGQLSEKMREHNIIPIFAVTRSEFQMYSELATFFAGATVGILQSDSGNIVDLVKENYEKIKSEVYLKDTSPKTLTVEYTAYCNGTAFPGSPICQGVRLGDTVNFSLAITAQECLIDPETRFTVSPVGFDDEVVILIETLCECECDIQSDQTCEENKPDCSDENKINDDATCRLGNSPFICSGRGACFCGECECFPRPNPQEIVSGTYCDCDNFSCDRYEGELCGGLNRGKCVCDEETRLSKCQCGQGFSGSACQCSTSTDSCLAANGKICNDHGDCNCAKCQCYDPYRGPRCEECLTCFGQCQKYVDCAMCKVLNKGHETECSLCPHLVITVPELTTSNTQERCIFYDTDGCPFIFTHETLKDGTVLLSVQENEVCGESADNLRLIVGTIVSISLIGLGLLIIWRLSVYILDKREIEKKQKASHVRRRGSHGQQLISEEAPVEFHEMATSNPYLTSNKSAKVQPANEESTQDYGNVKDDFTIPREQLKIITELGSGRFGQVFLAERKGGLVKEYVAIKTVKEGAPASEKENLLREMKTMKLFGTHPNVVELIGCCIEKDPYYIIVEHMANGSLRDFLMKSRKFNDYANTSERDVQSSLTQSQLIRFARQIADGMDFIASHQCIHRDLAARNILVGHDLVCKVSDFGLSRDVMDARVYERQSDTPLPIRWMALESLIDEIFTPESDVWSFGILLWEIITLGARPYPGMGSKAVMRDLRRGYRLPRPKHCQEEVYNIMLACWRADPFARPTFLQLGQQLESILGMKSDYLKLGEIDEDIYDDTALPKDDEKV